MTFSENVNTARCQIEAHIALRTGAGASGQIMPDENSEVTSPELLASLYNSGIESIFNYLDTKPLSHDMYKNTKSSSIDSSGCSTTSSVSSSTSSKSLKVRQEIMEIWKNVENEENTAWSSKNLDSPTSNNPMNGHLGQSDKQDIPAYLIDSLMLH